MLMNQNQIKRDAMYSLPQPHKTSLSPGSAGGKGARTFTSLPIDSPQALLERLQTSTSPEGSSLHLH